MKKVLGLSIAVGLVGAAWTLIANQLGILAWPGFIGWTIYFYGGADSKSIKYSLPSVFLGVFLAYLSAIIQNNFFSNGLWIFIPAFLLSFTMTYAQNIEIFKLVPAIFSGSILYFSTGSFFYALVISSIGIIGLGITSTVLGNFLDNLIYKQNKPLFS